MEEGLELICSWYAVAAIQANQPLVWERVFRRYVHLVGCLRLVLTFDQPQCKDGVANLCLEALLIYQDWKATLAGCKLLLSRITADLTQTSPLVLSDYIVVLDSLPKPPSLVALFHGLPPTLIVSITFLMFLFYERIHFEVEKDTAPGEEEEDVGRLVVAGKELEEEDLECTHN